MYYHHHSHHKVHVVPKIIILIKILTFFHKIKNKKNLHGMNTHHKLGKYSYHKEHDSV